jgi:hypothetical protein
MQSQTQTHKLIFHLGAGTAVFGGLLAAMVAVVLVLVTALHFVGPADRPTLRERLVPGPGILPKIFTPSTPEQKKSDAAKFGPVDRSKLDEIKGAPPSALEETKGQQSTCPTCPNYRPPSVGLLIAPRPAPVYPPPTYLPTYGPTLPNYATPTYATPSPGVPLRPGETLLHVGPWRTVTPPLATVPPIDQFGPVRPDPLEPYRTPARKLPEQIPLVDDGGEWGRPSRAVPDFDATPRGERKTGGYACANCRRPTVGEDWATQWTPEGTPITYLCRECWEKMTPEQRRTAYLNWYNRAAQ